MPGGFPPGAGAPGMSDDALRAYVTGLRMLASRELAEAQVRQRLARRKFEPDAIDAAVARLRDERALDDRRAAAACARTEAAVHGHGRSRVRRRLQAMGIARDVADHAIAETFGELDETALLQQVLERRLRRAGPLDDLRVVRRLHRYLMAQGFDGDRAMAALRRARAGEPPDD